VGTRTIAEAALAAGVARFVQISTVAVYPLTAERIDESHPLKESGDPYGWSKADAEREIFALIARGLKATILRPNLILGAHPTSTWGSKVPARIKAGQFKLMGDGLSKIGWIHVEDLVDAAHLAVAKEVAVGRAYNLVAGHVTWRQYVDVVRSWFGAPEPESVPLESLPPGAYWQGEFVTDRIREELGFQPRRTFAEGMAEAEAWWKAIG
jgi:nucleoside-diphosphate-sugar epimerase